MSKTARELYEAATGGEWGVQDNGNGGCIYIATDDVCDGDVADLYHKTASIHSVFRKHNCEANAELICRMHKSWVALVEASEDFVRKCDVGQARSTRSYAQMQAALALANGEDQP